MRRCWLTYHSRFCAVLLDLSNVTGYAFQDAFMGIKNTISTVGENTGVGWTWSEVIMMILSNGALAGGGSRNSSHGRRIATVGAISISGNRSSTSLSASNYGSTSSFNCNLNYHFTFSLRLLFTSWHRKNGLRNGETYSSRC